MKKCVIISIQPQWVEKILNGEKTIEIRKSIPKCELPIDVYIYCTKEKPYLYNEDFSFQLSKHNFHSFFKKLNGKIVAKFTLDKVEEIAYERLDNGVGYNHFFYCENDFDIQKNSCLDEFDLLNYLNPKKAKGNICGYAWHIDNLEIFDKPMELNQFYKNGTYNLDDFIYNLYRGYNAYADYLLGRRLKKAPQSWCYAYLEEF